MLQAIIDTAADQVFADYVGRRLRSCVLVMHDDGTREEMRLAPASRLRELDRVFDDAETIAEITCLSRHIGFAHVREQGHEIVFASVRDGEERAIIAVAITGRTGDPLTDLALLEGCNDICFALPSEWIGQRGFIKANIVPDLYSL